MVIASRRQFIALCAASSLAMSFSAHAAVAATSADNLIRSLGDEVIGVLVDSSLNLASRESRFRELLLRYVDTDSIARTVLGRYWNLATDAEKEDFKHLYREYIIKVYAARLSKFDGEVFKVRTPRQDSDADFMVFSTIEPKQGPSYVVNWRVRKSPEGFAITDVQAEGVSLLVTHNQEFSSVIQNGGGKVAALLDALRKRAGVK